VDEESLRAARNGNRTAREQLLRSLQDPLYRLCLGLLRDPEMARDATQETALRLLRALPNFRGGSSVTTWAMGIAINVTREMRRKREDRRWKMEDGEESADGRAERNEEKAVLRRVLDELPERQREAIVLRFFEELSVQETANAMKCAEGTVKATVHQALRAMKKKLSQVLML
jgi:RNA polymerase sigma-70 factor, ECF subfamily